VLAEAGATSAACTAPLAVSSAPLLQPISPWDIPAALPSPLPRSDSLQDKIIRFGSSRHAALVDTQAQKTRDGRRWGDGDGDGDVDVDVEVEGEVEVEVDEANV
jgi:hypothetical protein